MSQPSEKLLDSDDYASEEGKRKRHGGCYAEIFSRITDLKLNTDDRSVLKDEIKNFIRREVEVETQAKYIVKMRKTTRKVEVENFQVKDKVMRSKHKVRGHPEQIYINNEMTGSKEKAGENKSYAKKEKKAG
ncbi:hypothetical protein ILUMI_26976 [Ignelater luminosus]|uniref:Uncharacterized protein n=1 Tax=Ignelater luminosus TaxID=2038154 RepID=A0A8K0C5N7_IGNLU|nr:hypothetical protein ILUMI_26976 [Ignelater luminosus]